MGRLCCHPQANRFADFPTKFQETHLTLKIVEPGHRESWLTHCCGIRHVDFCEPTKVRASCHRSPRSQWRELEINHFDSHTTCRHSLSCSSSWLAEFGGNVVAIVNTHHRGHHFLIFRNFGFCLDGPKRCPTTDGRRFHTTYTSWKSNSIPFV